MIDINVLHEFLWRKRLSGDRMPFSFQEVKQELGIRSDQDLWATFERMLDEGRIVRVGRRFLKGSAVLVDPSVWRWEGRQSVIVTGSGRNRGRYLVRGRSGPPG